MTKKITFIQDNGENFPEWDEKTLGTILREPKKEAVSDPSQTELVTVKLYGKGIERTGKFPNKTANARPYYIRNQGELLIGRQNFHNGGMGILPFDLDGLIASNAISSYSLREEVKEQSSMEFIHFLISRKEFYSKVDKLIGGTGQKELSRSEFNKLRIPLPSLAEQEKIAEFFSALDERIALTADKVKLLKEQKAGYLQKIFAREIAFTDDNGDKYPEWEQKKLGEVADFINGFAFKPDHLGSEGTTVVKIKELLDPSDLSVKTTIDVPKSLHLENGDIIFSWSMTLACRIWSGGPAFLNQHLYKVVAKENCDSEFLNHLLNNELSELRNLMHGGTAKHITRKDLLPYKVMMPSLPEQLKIAEFFSTLDERIELTENKLTLLKEQKKGYLQGIFG